MEVHLTRTQLAVIGKRIYHLIAAVGIVVITQAFVMWCFPSVRPHFINSLGHSWSAMVTGTGTNTLGFVLWTLALTGVGWGATAWPRDEYNSNKRRRYPRSFSLLVVPSDQESFWQSVCLV